MLKHKILLSSLATISLIFLIPFSFLKYGFNVKSLDFQSVNIQGLYLKLDKKLITKIEYIKVKDSKDDQPLNIEPYMVEYTAKSLSYLFEKIKIDTIDIKNEKLSIDYKDSNFNIYSKKGDIDITFNLNDDQLTSNLNIKIPNSNLNLSTKVKLKDKNLHYELKTNKFSDLKFIEQYITLDKNVSSWIYDKLTASSYEIKNLYGDTDIKKLDKFNIEDINGQLIVKDISLNYDDKKPNLSLEKIIVDKIDDKIYLDLTHSKEATDKLSFSGKIVSNLKFNNITFDGYLYYYDLKLQIKLQIKDDIANITLSSDKFKDPTIFNKLVDIPDGIKKWGFERLKADSFKLDKLEVKLFLPHGILDKDSLRVSATIDDVVMDFNPGVAYPLKSEKVQIDFSKGDMKFKLEKPRSNDVDLSGSSAVIYNLFDKSGLLLDLQSNSPINWTLVRVVKSYGVELPDELGLRQIEGLSDIKTIIDIPFDDDPTKVYVKIDTNDSLFSIKDQNVSFKEFHFLYDKDIVKIQKSKIFKDDINIDFGVSFFINSNQAVLDASIYDDNKTFKLNLSNVTNLDKNLSSGSIYLKHLKVDDNFTIKDQDIPYSVKLGSTIQGYIPTLMTRYSFKDDLHKVNIDSFQKFYQLLPQLKDKPKVYGSLEFITKNFSDIDITTSLGGLDYPIFYNNEKIKNINLDINIKNKDQINIKDNRHLNLDIDLKENLSIIGELKDIGIQLHSTTDKFQDINKTDDKEEFKLKDLTLPYIDLNIKNGYLAFDGKAIDYEVIKLFTNKKQIDIDANIEDSTLYFRKYGDDKISFKLKNLDDKILNKFIGSKLIVGDGIDIVAIGDDKKLKGYIDINNLELFNEDENSTIYKISKGNLYYNFDINTTELNVSNLTIKGDLASVDGDMVLNLDKDKIDANLKAYVIEGYSDFINYIPIVNYIFLGEDKKVDYSAKIDGKLSKPNVKTAILKESALVPFYIIGRIIYLPVKAIDSLNSK